MVGGRTAYTECSGVRCEPGAQYITCSPQARELGSDVYIRSLHEAGVLQRLSGSSIDTKHKDHQDLEHFVARDGLQTIAEVLLEGEQPLPFCILLLLQCRVLFINCSHQQVRLL